MIEWYNSRWIDTEIKIQGKIMKNYDKNTSAWFGNVPGDFFAGVPQDFSVTKNDIVSIHFTDTLKDMPDSAWDISAGRQLHITFKI